MVHIVHPSYTVRCMRLLVHTIRCVVPLFVAATAWVADIAKSIKPTHYSPSTSIVAIKSVRLSAREHTSGTTRPIFTKFLLVLPVAVARSSYSGVAICYVVPVLWTTSFLRVRSGSYGGLSIALQRVTSLRRRSQASAAVASCPIDHGERRDYRRVHRARGAGGGACSALTPCFLFAGRRLVSWTPKW